MITENYIKMCEQAEEIQKLCQYGQGDWFINVAHEFEVIPDWATEHMKEWYKYYYHKWLPTQEQLQEMLTMDTNYAKEYNKKTGAIFCGFYIFLDMMDWVRNWLEKPTKINCNSLNEMWLSYVMYKKYNKFWTGEKWKTT